MAVAAAPSNKAKIARRVIEVLEYFDDEHTEATVMDIVRRYNRPQSSTSELLASLVELGILSKEPHSRSYRLTPRAALLGTAGQRESVRNGTLIKLMDRLVAQTGLSVGLFGMVGLKTQIITWRAGARDKSTVTASIFGGLQRPLDDSAVGWLLLSTIAQPRRDSVLRRLNAEAADDRKFNPSELARVIDECEHSNSVCGSFGFDSLAQTHAVLLPIEAHDHPIAIGFVHPAHERINSASLIQCLNEAIEHCFYAGSQDEPTSIAQFSKPAEAA